MGIRNCLGFLVFIRFSAGEIVLAEQKCLNILYKVHHVLYLIVKKKKKRKVERKIVGFFVYRRLKLKYFDEDRKNYRINYYSSI